MCIAEHVPRSSRAGRQRHDHPAGHRARGRRAGPGVRVHGRGRRAGTRDGRFRDGGRCARNRAAARPAAAPGNVRGPAATAAPLSAVPPAHRGRRRTRTSLSRAGVRPDAAAAAQDHGHPDPVAVGAEFPAAVCGAQTLHSPLQDRRRTARGIHRYGRGRGCSRIADADRCTYCRRHGTTDDVHHRTPAADICRTVTDLDGD